MLKNAVYAKTELNSFWQIIPESIKKFCLFFYIFWNELLSCNKSFLYG